MMAARDIKKASDNLSCPVCYQLFKNPKYLPCHHSYCEQCLEKMQVQSNKIICPECRKEAIVPPGGVKDLDDSVLINRLVDESTLKRKVEGKAEVKCDKCHEENPVATFCPDCTLHVCNEDHKHSKEHCSPLTELRSKKDVAIQPTSKVMMCRKHDIELLFYCETCDQLVCVYCAVKDHNGHNHDTVENMIDKHRQELKKITAPVEEIIEALSDTHDNIEMMRKKIRQQGNEVNKNIDQYYDGVIQKLMKQKEQLKQQVHDTVSQKVKAVTTQLEEVEYVQAEALSMKELNDAMEKSSDQEVLSVKKQVIDCMQQINKKHERVNLPPVQQPTMEFIHINKALPQFGFVCSTNSPDPYNCNIVDLPKYSIKEKKTIFTVITKDNSGDRCFRQGSQVSVEFEGVDNATQVRDNNDGSFKASFVRQQAGEVKLSVFVNGEHIKGSPYSVMVRDYASVNKPIKTRLKQNKIKQNKTKQSIIIVNNDGNMGQPWGIAVSKNGMWAVADYSNHCVYIFDGENQLIRKFGSKGTNGSQFYHPAGVAFDSDDHLYIADHNNHRVQKFTIDGKYLFHFGDEGSLDSRLRYPSGLVVHNHKVYVMDYGNVSISVFQTDGNYYQTILSDQLSRPRDAAVNCNNQLLVTDADYNCIHIFTLDGNYVGKFSTQIFGLYCLNRPYGITIDFYGFVLVSDTYNHRMSIFDGAGNRISSFGFEGSADGQFKYPYGTAVGTNGNIYVSDSVNKRIQIFSC